MKLYKKRPFLLRLFISYLILMAGATPFCLVAEYLHPGVGLKKLFELAVFVPIFSVAAGIFFATFIGIVAVMTGESDAESGR